MRKNIKYIIVGLAIVVICFLYSHIDKAHSIYDESIDTSLYAAANLEQGSSVSQVFLSEEEELSGMSAKIAVKTNSDKAKLSYILQDVKGAEILKEDTLIRNLKSGRINKIKFSETIRDSKNKQYKILFSVSGLQPGDNAQIYYNPQEKESKSVEINGEKTKGTLIFRTLTYRFDMETFIVCFGFIAYFLLFFSILYRLFS